MAGYSAVVDQLRRTFKTGRTLPIDFRKEQLGRLLSLVTENKDEICNAIYADIKRSKAEAYCFEVQFVVNEINSAISDLAAWMAPKKVSRNLMYLLDEAYTLKDPLGVVLIISPWNYPINLLFTPLVGALAAGNTVVLKPSEIAENTADLVQRLVKKYFDEDVVKVVIGGVLETTDLLKERFDHIFYTGAPGVGKIIMQAASKHLTPVTLELGGKCPAIVDREVDLRVVGRRIAWGKFMSCGQTCLAPDYVLCPSELQSKLVDSIKNALTEYYTEDPQSATDYSRIISARHYSRLLPFLSNSGVVAVGGKVDESDLYIEPTILVDVNGADPVMQDEIFGPILPIVTVNSVDDAIDIVNDGEKPLGLYIFSRNKTTVKKVLERTSSGGVTVNDCILHMALDTLPFGGVGQSGIGRYHGKYSFDTFSHEKAVLQRDLTGEQILWMRYPPYNDQKFYWTKQMARKRKLPEFLFIKYVPFFFLGLLLGYVLQVWRSL